MAKTRQLQYVSLLSWERDMHRVPFLPWRAWQVPSHRTKELDWWTGWTVARA